MRGGRSRTEAIMREIEALRAERGELDGRIRLFESQLRIGAALPPSLSAKAEAMGLPPAAAGLTPDMINRYSRRLLLLTSTAASLLLTSAALPSGPSSRPLQYVPWQWRPPSTPPPAASSGAPEAGAPGPPLAQQFDSEKMPQTLVSEIRPFLRVANQIEAESPRVAYLCRFHAFEKAHIMDPRSTGRGVRQFKTALLQRLEQDEKSTLLKRKEKHDAREEGRWLRFVARLVILPLVH